MTDLESPSRAKARAREFPGLKTERLTLRAPLADDAAFYGALLARSEVVAYSDLPLAPNATKCARLMRWMMRLHPSGNGCAWIIELGLRGKREAIGAIRFNHIEKRALWGVVGYEIAPEHWGLGLTSEALRAVVEHGHKRLKLNRIEAWTLEGNGASDRVLEKNGFRFEGTQRGKARFKGSFHDLRIFGRLASDPR